MRTRKRPKVSVVIPVYNGEKTLKSCLKSVLNQTYKNYEVIVVDNNSTDETKEIIYQFKESNKKIKYVFEAHVSRGAARNSGIKAAKGEIIAMTDADCVVPKNWLEKLTEPIIEEGETAVMGSEEDLIKNYWTKNIQKANCEYIKRHQKNSYIYHIDTKNFAITSLLIKKVMFDPALKNLDDFDLYLRLKGRYQIRFLPLVLAGHYHKNSFSKVVYSNFDRGYWATKIYRKNKGINGEAMLVSMSLLNFLSFPFWIVPQFLTKSIGEAFFLLVTEVSWRMGILWALTSSPFLYQAKPILSRQLND